MGSQKPRVIRLSESAPPKNYGAVYDELEGKAPEEEKRPERPQLVGSIKEKGFSIDPLPRHRVSLPQPRVTPFPVARHRSDGPHWGPASRKELSDPVIEFNEDWEGGETSAAEMAVPLSRRKPAQSLTSKWKSSRKSELTISSQIQNEFDDTRQQNRPQETSNGTIERRDHGVQQLEPRDEVEVVANAKESIAKPSHTEQSTNITVQKLGHEEVRASAREIGQRPNQMPSPMLVDDRIAMERVDPRAAQATQSGLNASTDRDIDAENRKALFRMSAEEVAEAQAEVSQKLRPELLELLRRRGAEKERKRLAEKAGTSIPVTASEGRNRPVALPGDKKEVAGSQSPSSAEEIRTAASMQRSDMGMTVSDKQAEIVRGTTVGPADLLTAAPSFTQEEIPSKEAAGEIIPPPPTTDPWTLRVEAVRSTRFDLNGSAVSVGPPPQSSDAVQSDNAGVPANGMRSSFSVGERDYLRTDGDPVGAGYSLKDALALVRSTVPGQRAVALHLIASVLDKAIQGLQDQKADPTSTLNGEGAGGRTDWQAIWAYALGPEAELVLTLRLALDDGHFTVVAACARAIQALLSYSANESYFDTLEVLWPGEKANYTAPAFRRKTKYDEGFIGGGRWKYNVKTSEMFPFAKTAAQDQSEEGGKDTVGDDSHVSNKDVAAGLIRMGILPRIRYLLEVDQLIAAEEALLNVLICLARHSPLAANAVMTCPRLIDAIMQRFISTNEHLSKESWTSRLKAIRLLKVLSQSKKANCVHFERVGALQAAMAPLLQQRYVNDNSGLARSLEEGYYEIMIETVRFWRVCIDYGVGILLFSDCYPTLCFWLLPLSKEEILSAGKEEPLLLAIESYLLLEHIARTLPSLHAPGDVMKQVDGESWPWSVAQAMTDTAMKWLSPECISGVQLLLEQCVLPPKNQSQVVKEMKSSTRRLLGVLASVLHFLATVCEKVLPESELQCALGDPKNFSLPWLPTFLPKLGLALARSGLLDYSQMDLPAEMPKSTLQFDMSTPARESNLEVPTVIAVPGATLKKVTFLECLKFCQAHADYDSTLAAINLLNGIVRANNVVDSLIYIAKPKASLPLEDQTLAHRVLEDGLLLSAETQLRNLLDLCKENVTLRKGLLQMSVRGGPAPGVGIGWGCLCGGAWSKEIMIAQASARLALDLMSVFSSRVWLSHPDTEGDPTIQRSELSQRLLGDLASNINFGLSVIATSTPVNRELVLRACSSIIFNPSTLSFFIHMIEEVLVSWRDNRAREECSQVESHAEDDKIFGQDHLSKILVKHCENFWLTSKKRKDKQDVLYRVHSNSQSNGLRSNLATVQEESGEDSSPRPESLMAEWVAQRLPLPSHWFLSPMVGNLLLSTKSDLKNGTDDVSQESGEVEEVIKAGLAFFLGFEVLASNVSEVHSRSNKISLVRKLHSLSTVFVSGGDVFLDPRARDLIGALQNLLGDQLGERSAHLRQNSTEGSRTSGDDANDLNGLGFSEASVVQDDPTIGDILESDSIMTGAASIVQNETIAGNVTESESIKTEENETLDFEGSIDASYLTYAETIAEQFVAASYGDHVFGRQVAFHLCVDVPAMIRLATWRVLTDGRVLELLPPLSQCAGPPQKYLYPVEENQQILESFVSAWSSGALDKAAKRNSLPFTLALHHLAGYLFETSDTEETVLLKMKTARALVRSTVRKLDRQDMLSRLVHYVPARIPFNGGQTMDGAETKLTDQYKLRLSLLFQASEGDTLLTAEVQQLHGRQQDL